VHSLPDGYDTMIDEEASNISAGEKQLLTIARAFLAEPSLLILDEATCSVDTCTECSCNMGWRHFGPIESALSLRIACPRSGTPT
jgi:ABC-type multidrug transport system fused ATPase/permease subunit